MSFNETDSPITREPQQLSCAALAYLGDSVLEIMVRAHIVTNFTLFSGEAGPSHYSDLAKQYVTAVAQSEAVERILPHLTEEEFDIYKRGRNNLHTAPPKSASTGQYRRATGFECLLGFLYLQKQDARLHELFALAYPSSQQQL